MLKTVDRVRYTIDRFKVLTYGPIDDRSRSPELQPSGILGTRGIEVEILTSTAEVKASSQELFINFVFAHALSRGGGNDEGAAVRTTGSPS